MASENQETSRGRRWIAEVLRRNWDPVGADTSPARFKAFVERIESLISKRVTPKELAEYLVRVETQALGYQDSEPKMLIPVAKKLLRLNATIGPDDSAA